MGLKLTALRSRVHPLLTEPARFPFSPEIMHMHIFPIFFLIHPRFLACTSYKVSSSFIGNRCTLTPFVERLNGLAKNVSRDPRACTAASSSHLLSPNEWKERPSQARDLNSLTAHAGLVLLSSYLSHICRHWGNNTRLRKIKFPEERYLRRWGWGVERML